MISQNTRRESNRVEALVVEYRRKGYNVTAPVSASDVPEFMRDWHYLPDILATSEDENLVVEVKSRETAADLHFLSSIAEKVNSRPNWKFVLVFTNPRKIDVADSLPNEQRAYEQLAKSKNVGIDPVARVEAAFLFAWSALEASLRLMPFSSERKKGVPTTSIASLIRDAATQGVLARADAQLLDSYLKIRNSILHAGQRPTPDDNDVECVQRIVREILDAKARDD